MPLFAADFAIPTCHELTTYDGNKGGGNLKLLGASLWAIKHQIYTEPPYISKLSSQKEIHFWGFLPHLIHITSGQGLNLLLPLSFHSPSREIMAPIIVWCGGAILFQRSDNRRRPRLLSSIVFDCRGSQRLDIFQLTGYLYRRK